MRVLALLLAGALSAALAPATAWAQGGDCQLLPGAREARRVAFADGREMVHISGPANFSCPGGVVIKADSVAGVPSSGEFELIGQVFYQDSAKVLTADWVRYLRTDAHLYARGNVDLTDRKSGSRVKGPELEYLSVAPGRPEARAIVPGRPHATLYQQQTTPSDSAPQPLEIDADLIELLGEDRFVARGQVEMLRGESKGYAREAEYDQSSGLMMLTGAARLEGEGYTLKGERVEAFLQQEKLREVLAREDASLLAEELDVRAPELRVFFTEGKVERMIALRGATDSASAAPQPVAVAKDFRLVGDSIDALAPAEQLERIVAVGNAYGEHAADSTGASLPAVIAHDWMRGDTITGFFAPDPNAAAGKGADSTVKANALKAGEQKAEEPKRAKAVLERLVAVGENGNARSLYRMREKGHEDGPPNVNYLVANRIVLLMREGEVKDVEADGPIQGMHLQPSGQRGKSGPPDPTPPAGGSR